MYDSYVNVSFLLDQKSSVRFFSKDLLKNYKIGPNITIFKFLLGMANNLVRLFPFSVTLKTKNLLEFLNNLDVIIRVQNLW